MKDRNRKKKKRINRLFGLLGSMESFKNVSRFCRSGIQKRLLSYSSCLVRCYVSPLTFLFQVPFQNLTKAVGALFRGKNGRRFFPGFFYVQRARIFLATESRIADYSRELLEFRATYTHPNQISLREGSLAPPLTQLARFQVSWCTVPGSLRTRNKTNGAVSIWTWKNHRRRSHCANILPAPL